MNNQKNEFIELIEEFLDIVKTNQNQLNDSVIQYLLKERVFYLLKHLDKIKTNNSYEIKNESTNQKIIMNLIETVLERNNDLEKKENTCGYCKEKCNNDWCITNQSKEEE